MKTSLECTQFYISFLLSHYLKRLRLFVKISQIVLQFLRGLHFIVRTQSLQHSILGFRVA